MFLLQFCACMCAMYTHFSPTLCIKLNAWFTYCWSSELYLYLTPSLLHTLFPILYVKYDPFRTYNTFKLLQIVIIRVPISTMSVNVRLLYSIGSMHLKCMVMIPHRLYRYYVSCIIYAMIVSTSKLVANKVYY